MGQNRWPPRGDRHPDSADPVTSPAVLMGGMVGQPRWRVGALVAGVIATVLMVIVGCTSVTGGTAQVDGNEAPAYRTSMSASASASAATSRARESKRLESLTTEAVHNSCDALSASSVDSIAAVNNYVAAVNTGGAAVAAARARPAIDALNRSADLVVSSLSDALSPQLRSSLEEWVDAAMEMATTIDEEKPPREFNSAVDTLNDVRKTALDLCDAAY